MANLRQHFLETGELARAVPAKLVGRWLLERGYFPESYVLPPSFNSTCFCLRDEPYASSFGSLTRRQLEYISYPKSVYATRQFGVIHPWNYHDIVFWLCSEWETILDCLFSPDLRIYSYSFPIPLTASAEGKLGSLRSGRMIYEWISMAERDLVIDAGSYSFLVRTDIANFYGSIYTHSIPWAIHGREEALQDKDACSLIGNKIDRLLQYSNDARTNGIPVGSALCDLLAEILLAAVDRKVSSDLGQGDLDFVGARYKDDYRFLCKSEHDGLAILRYLSESLGTFNLVVNERKTSISRLPEGLYRKHDREYFPYSLAKTDKIPFKLFEQTLLRALDVHNDFPGTSILEKFVNELFNRERVLKLEFSWHQERRLKEVKKVVELLFFAKRQSPKLLCHVLAICEQLYLRFKGEFPDLKPFLRGKLGVEISLASEYDSTFEVVWYIFFSRFLGLGIAPETFKAQVQSNKVCSSGIYRSMLASKQLFYNDIGVSLFSPPKHCKDQSLAQYVGAFTGTKITSLRDE